MVQKNARLVFTSDNISSTLQFTWTLLPSEEKNGALSDLSNDFAIDWHLIGSTDTVAGTWTSSPKVSNSKTIDWIKMSVMSLVREGIKKGVVMEKIWEVLLKHRWNTDDVCCLSETEQAEVIAKIGQELGIGYVIDT